MKSRRFFLVLGVIFFLLFAVSNSWAKGKIYGQIKMPDGTPAKGVGVIAWDSDGLAGGKDDFMCSATTDSRGIYSMSYKIKYWDTKFPGSNSDRPDIYLTIHTIEVGTLPVKKTGKKNNWNTSKDLLIDVNLPGIMGRITGAPATGVVVKAFDSDGVFSGKDDRIAQTKTGPDGRYMMLYGGKHYDSTPPSPGRAAGYLASSVTFPGIDILVKHVVDHGWNGQMHKRWTSWRPDIYVKVYANPVKTSRVYKDWPHRKTLNVEPLNVEPIKLTILTISGKIRDTRGRPVAGAPVKAYDYDGGTGGNGDFMAQAITDSNGCYSMSYKLKHWDRKVTGSTTWRPDIYVVAYRNNAELGKSGTYTDWNMLKPLTANITVPAATTGKSPPMKAQTIRSRGALHQNVLKQPIGK
ncbi:MAG: hypothetical protein JXB42_06200 [Deltaproteobacteria bacterium]|nr:hypothetical protein [Deltaproteobacteria bacterium]